MHIYIHTGIYQHVSVPRCPSTLQNCFAFHELLGPNYKSSPQLLCFFYWCDISSYFLNFTQKIFKKPKSETLGNYNGTFAVPTNTFRLVPGRFQLVTLRYGRSYRSLALGAGGPAGAGCAPTAGGQRFVG